MATDSSSSGSGNSPPPPSGARITGQATLTGPISVPLGVVSADGDKSRWVMGVVCFATGLLAFVGGVCWAARSIEDASTTILANETLTTLPDGAALLYIAKAVLVLTIEGFAIALLRTAERLTMPLARYLQYVEKQGHKEVSESTAQQAVDLVQKVLDVIRQGKELGQNR